MLSPTVLLYNLTGPRAQAVEQVCRRRGAAVRQVPPMDQGKPLGALLGIPVQAQAKLEQVPGEMLVLAFFERQAMEELLDALAAAGAAVGVLKAGLTPTNSAWTGPRLYRELLREHREMNG